MPPPGPCAKRPTAIRLARRLQTPKRPDHPRLPHRLPHSRPAQPRTQQRHPADHLAHRHLQAANERTWQATRRGRLLRHRHRRPRRRRLQFPLQQPAPASHEVPQVHHRRHGGDPAPTPDPVPAHRSPESRDGRVHGRRANFSVDGFLPRLSRPGHRHRRLTAPRPLRSGPVAGRERCHHPRPGMEGRRIHRAAGERAARRDRHAGKEHARENQSRPNPRDRIHRPGARARSYLRLRRQQPPAPVSSHAGPRCLRPVRRFHGGSRGHGQSPSPDHRHRDRPHRHPGSGPRIRPANPCRGPRPAK